MCGRPCGPRVGSFYARTSSFFFAVQVGAVDVCAILCVCVCVRACALPLHPAHISFIGHVCGSVAMGQQGCVCVCVCVSKMASGACPGGASCLSGAL